MVKTTKSLKIDNEIWKQIKIYSAKNDISISEFIEKSVKEVLKKK